MSSNQPEDIYPHLHILNLLSPFPVSGPQTLIAFQKTILHSYTLIECIEMHLFIYRIIYVLNV